MRIAYGVMGYGRGHSTRAHAVLPALMQEHEVTVFAGGDAYDMLAVHFPTVRIPTLGYVYGKDGRASFAATLKANARQTTGLMLGGETVQGVMRELRTREIQLVISDSEAWTHQAARRLRIPRISFDHVGVIPFCKPHAPPELAWQSRRDAWGYRQLMGQPDRIVVSSFYPAEPRSSTTRVVGPILRPIVCAAKPSSGEHLLVYFNRGQLQYSTRLEQELMELDLPVLVYGTRHSGMRQNLTFREIDPDRFVEDFASCRAVLATAGNQLIGEALHLRKPILALPENVFEQKLNAWMVQRMGIGRASSFAGVTAGEIELFLTEAPACAARMDDFAGNGSSDAIAALRQFIGELAPTAVQAYARHPTAMT
jgi:uncharacterized protein (TIGR00661 family)